MKHAHPILFAALALTVASILISGCKTEPLSIKGNPVQSFQSNTFSMTGIFLDRYTLQKRYGNKNNPFINVNYLITPREFMVIDLIVRAEDQDLRLDVNKMRVEYATQNVTPLNKFLLIQHWNQEDQQDRDVRPIDTARKRSLINKTLLPDKVRISQGGSVRGLVVFSANFPKTGEAVLTVPVFDASGKLIERAKMKYRFELSESL